MYNRLAFAFVSHLPMTMKKLPAWEKYWGWVVVFGRFTALFMLLGTYKSFGVLMDYYIDDLDANGRQAGWATCMFFTIIYFTAPISGVLTDIQGPNGARTQIMLGGILAAIGLCLSALSTTWIHLALTLSLAGVGYGMVQVPTVAPILMYFAENKFGLANGISAAGGAVGMVVLPPITEYLIEVYGWRGASLILGVTSLNTTVAGALMRPPTSAFMERNSYSRIYGEDDCDPNEASNKFVFIRRFASLMKERLSLEVFRKQPRFILYQVIFLLASVQFAGWHLFLVPNALNHGIQSTDAALLASIGGVGNIFGRAGTGPPLDHKIFSDTMLFALIHLSCAIALLFDPLALAYGTMAVLAFIAGGAIGAGYTVTVVIAKNLAGDDESAVMAAIGWTHFFMGFGALVGGPIVGATFDITGHYTLGFVIMGILEALVAILTFLETLHRRHTHNLAGEYKVM